MDDKTEAMILTVIARAPEWLRNDLAAKDAAAKARAEETLAAMIADALGKDDSADA